MAVLERGQSQSGLIALASSIALVPFHNTPTVVHSLSSASCRSDINFLDTILPHVSDVQVSVGSIEAEPPGIAEPIAPDLSADCRLLPDKGVIRRHRVRGSRLDVNPKNGSEQLREVLTPALRITGSAAVAESQVEKPIWTEHDLPPVVI